MAKELEKRDAREELRRLALLTNAAPDLLAALNMVLARWTFDNNQQHTHTWHDWADCAEVICAAIAKASPAPTGKVTTP